MIGICTYGFIGFPSGTQFGKYTGQLNLAWPTEEKISVVIADARLQVKHGHFPSATLDTICIR